MPEYLMRPKGSRNWVVRVAVPRQLWGVVGRKEYQRTTGTPNREEAESLRHQIIRDIRQEIAALADHHFSVSKHSQGKRTITKVVKLSEKQRVEEVARMIGGTEISSSTRKTARDLISISGDK